MSTSFLKLDDVQLNKVMDFLDPREASRLSLNKRFQQANDARLANPALYKSHAVLIAESQKSLKENRLNVQLFQMYQRFVVAEQLLVKSKDSFLGSLVWKSVHSTSCCARFLALIFSILEKIFPFIKAKREEQARFEQDQERWQKQITQFNAHHAGLNALAGYQALKAHNNLMRIFFDSKVARKISELFPNGLREYQSLPLLHIDKTGSTGYIDFITCDQMTAPIMRGVDPVDRRFICFRVKITVKETGQTFKERAWTIFERYPNRQLWLPAGSYRPSFGAIGIVNDNDYTYSNYEDVKKWIADRRLETDEEIIEIY